MNNNKEQCREYYLDNDYPVDVKSKVHPYVRSEDTQSGS